MVSVKNTTKAVELDQLEWSNVEYPFSKFLDRFRLPQLVKVQDGFCSREEACSLSTGQILTVRTIKTTDKVLARDQTNSKLRIPLDCSQKVELCPPGAREVPGTKDHLREHKFVRVLQDPHHRLDCQGSTVCPGIKLEVVQVKGGIKKGHVVFKNEVGGLVSLPVNSTTTFQPLVDGRAYSVKEVSAMKLPVYFKFIDSPKTTVDSVFSSSLGVLKLEKVYRDTAVIYTITSKGIVRVFACPKKMSITVCVPQGALEGDKGYISLCHSLQGALNLPKIAHLESENIYEDPDNIREYILSAACSSTSVDQQGGLLQNEGNKEVQEAKTDNSEDGEAGELLETSVVVPARPPLKPRRRSVPPSPPRTCAELSNEKSIEETLKGGSTTVAPKTAGMVSGCSRACNTARKMVGRSDVTVKPKPPPKPSRRPVVTPPSSADEIINFEIPDDLKQLSVREVSKFLMKVHLADIVDVFKENDVDGAMLGDMTVEMMRALHLNAFQSTKLQKLIKGWRPKV